MSVVTNRFLRNLLFMQWIGAELPSGTVSLPAFKNQFTLKC